MAVLVESGIDTTRRIREVDLSRAMRDVDAEHNPFTSMLRRGPIGSASSTLLEWTASRVARHDGTALAGLRDGVALDPVANGATFEDRTAILQGRPQRQEEVIAVGKIANAMTKQYGQKAPDKWKEYVKFALQRLRSKLEYACLSNSDSIAQTGSVGFVSRGMTNWIGRLSTGGDLPLPAAWIVTPTASVLTGQALATDVTEAEIRAVLLSIYTAGYKSRNLVCFASLAFAEAFNAFVLTATQSATVLPLRRFTNDQKDDTITLMVNKYVCGWGTFTIIPCVNTLPSGVHGLFIDMDEVDMTFIQNPTLYELEDRGAGRNGFADWIMTLRCWNPQAHGKITT